MKILHTADWHLGKRLMGKNRLDEQRALLAEITEIVKSEGVSVVLIAGDVFDAYVPTAEAEELFYETLTAIASYALPVVIAGNHDDALRLGAARSLARATGIVLCGDEDASTLRFTRGDVTVTGGDGYVTIKKGEETLNVGVLSFPTQGKLLAIVGEADFSEYVKERIAKSSACFKKGEINVFVSHLFITGAETTDERELGGTKLLPKSVTKVENCNYFALGHIHKPMTVSRENNAVYSGSIMQTSFDDTAKKRVVIVDSDGNETHLTSVPLSNGKTLKKIAVTSEVEAISALEENAGNYVLIEYRSATPLLPSAVAEMKKHECYCGIEVVTERQASEQEESRKDKSDEELFEMFYEHKTGKKPEKELVELFLRAINGDGEDL